MEKSRFKSQSGQALLIVVLVMVIALTIGLAVVSKSIIGMRMSTEQSESQKALAAAEAGIEQALKASANINLTEGNFSNNSTFKYSANQVKGPSFELNGGNLIVKDEGFDLWLSDYSTDPAKSYLNPWSGTLSIRWGDSTGACNNAALEIIVLSIPAPSASIPSPTKNDAVMTRYAADPCTPDRTTYNHFTPIGPSGNNYAVTLNPIVNGLLVRIIPLYRSTSISVDGGANALPSQGFIIESTGYVNETARKVTVFRGYPRIPSELFSYSLFTP
jgi:hypothetical protein